MNFLQSVAYKRDLLARLDLAVALSLGNFEVLQFTKLERGRIEPIKKNTCLDCGVPLSGPSRHCRMHDNAMHRGKPRK
jgi:hypothetical protein